MRSHDISTESDAATKFICQPDAAAASGLQDVGARNLEGEISFFQRVFSFPAFLASLLVGLGLIPARAFRVDPDLWWHLKVGQVIFATHHWPTKDAYSFTVSGQPWLAYEWLGEVLLAWAYRLAGIVGLEVLLFLSGSCIILALYVLTTLRCGNSKAAFVASTILSVLAAMSFTLRPQMIGYLFLIITLIVLERFRRGKKGAVWCLPVIMLLWVNSHGSWIIGLGVIFVYWMSGLVKFPVGYLETRSWTLDERQRIAFAFLLCLCSVFITPYGSRLATSPFEFAFSLPLNVAYISEWQSMPFHVAIGKVFLSLMIGFILFQTIFQLRWRLEEFSLFLFGTAMACLHVRFFLIFVPFFAPLLAVIIARWMPAYDRKKDKLALNVLLMAGVVVSIIHYFPSQQELQKIVASKFPVAAVKYLSQRPVPGPTYNNYGFGGYLIWARGPENKVFIDGRGDVYERGGVLSDYLHISRFEPGSLELLDAYQIQSCLITGDEPLATALYSSSGWQRLYADDVSSIFVRKETKTRLKNEKRELQ
jgi:hypothetical protein